MSSNEASQRRLNHINMKPNIEGVCVCVWVGGHVSDLSQCYTLM